VEIKKLKQSGNCNGDVKTVAVMEILAGTDVYRFWVHLETPNLPILRFFWSLIFTDFSSDYHTCLVFLVISRAGTDGFSRFSLAPPIKCEGYNFFANPCS
jgi:hypothetical protein